MSHRAARSPAAGVSDPRALLHATALALAALAWATLPAHGQPVIGYTQNWNPADGLAGWTGGSSNSNPGTGGVDGAGDGFLRVATATVANLGANSSLDPAFAGDYLAAGVNRITLWLNDVDSDDALELHLMIGHGGNFWQRNAAFLPPHNTWAEYVVDLDGPTGWTKTHGITPETYADALRTADRIHIRHDRPPFTSSPDGIAGQYGLDKVTLTSSTVGVDPPGAGVVRPLELRAPYPNPSRGPVTFAMVQHRPAEIRIEIVDVAGRRIQSARLPAAGAGPRTWLWDGRDANGNRVAPGAYRVRATSADGGMSQPLLRIE